MSGQRSKAASPDASDAKDSTTPSEAIRELMWRLYRHELTPEVATGKIAKFIVQLVEFSNGNIDALGLVQVARREEREKVVAYLRRMRDEEPRSTWMPETRSRLPSASRQALDEAALFIEAGRHE